jgi:hypothetical protein
MLQARPNASPSATRLILIWIIVLEPNFGRSIFRACALCDLEGRMGSCVALYKEGFGQAGVSRVRRRRSRLLRGRRWLLRPGPKPLRGRTWLLRPGPKPLGGRRRPLRRGSSLRRGRSWPPRPTRSSRRRARSLGQGDSPPLAVRRSSRPVGRALTRQDRRVVNTRIGNVNADAGRDTGSPHDATVDAAKGADATLDHDGGDAHAGEGGPASDGSSGG